MLLWVCHCALGINLVCWPILEILVENRCGSSQARVWLGKLNSDVINNNTNRQHFRNSRIKSNETPKDCRLKGLYEKWIRPVEKYKEKIGDTIVLKQFLKVLSPELIAVELAEALITARRSEEDYSFNRGRSIQPTGRSHFWFKLMHQEWA
uniref:SCAN box domain-containing protein n=1 Tax=Astyanax mexicanus TaxID=7994 RepID=A0A3B1J2N8_ASTMX